VLELIYRTTIKILVVIFRPCVRYNSELNLTQGPKIGRTSRMNKTIMKQTVAATLLASSIFSGTSITYGKEMTIQQSIDAVKLEMKKAPLHYVDPALKRVLEPSKDLYPVLNNVKKHYKEVKKQIQTSNLSTKVKKDKIKELDALYDEKIIKGVIPYIDAYNYAVKYLDPILKEMLDAHAKGDLDGVEQAYHKLSYQLDSRTSILYRFTGKAPRDLLLEKYKKPSDAKRDELRIPVTIFMKNNDVLRLWNEGKKEEARKVMDEVLTLVAKTTNNGDTNYSNLLSKEVQEAEALFSAQPTPSPAVPSNPSISEGDNEPKESSSERKLRIAKSNAIVELEKYKDANKEDYSLTNWSTILSLKTTWTSTIHSATSPTDVDKALSDAKAAIDVIQTSSQEALTTAKENAKTDLATYKVTDQDDYSTANWDTILSIKTTWTSTINSATTEAEVDQALNDAKAAITQVQTSEQEALVTAKAQAIEDLTDFKTTKKDDYSTANWDAILSIKTTWTSTINSATTEAEVDQALNDAKAAIHQVQTIEQEALDTAKAQAIENLTDFKTTEKDNYSTANWDSILSIKTTWTSTINSATTVAEVDQALKDAKAAIEQVLTSEQEALVTAKAKAIEDLTDFKTTKKDDYSTANWDAILSIKTTWTSTINSATTVAEVDQALNDAKAAIPQVQTSEQEALVKAKAQAIEDLTDFKTTEKDNYSTENWDNILSIKTTWTSLINAATTEAEVVQALNDAKAAITQVQTTEKEVLAQTKAQAITELTDYKTLVKDDYSTANWDTILSMKTIWTSTINSATTEAEVVQALSDAKAAIDQVEDRKSKTLIADSSSNNVDNKLEITIQSNSAWKSKIVEVKVDNTSLTSDQYNIVENILTINQGVIKSRGIKRITIVADGYEESTVNQIVNAGEFNKIKSSVQHIGGVINVGGTPVYKLSAKDQYGNVIEGYNFGLKLSAVNNNHRINEKVDISSDGLALITYTMPQTTAGIPAIVDTPIGVTNSNGELIVTIHYFGRGIQGTDFDYNDSVGPLWFDASGNRIF